MKRILCILLMALVMSTSFTACNLSKEKSNESINQDGKTPVTITVWTGSEYIDSMKERVAMFNQKYPWINVDLVVHDGDRVKDFITASAVGNAPDQTAVSFPMLTKMVAAKLVAPIDEYWDKWDEKDAFNPEIVKFCRVDNKLYGIPGGGYLNGLVYNKRLFKEAGIEHAPTTWDELLAEAKKLSNPAKQQTGFGLLIAQFADWWFEYFVWQAGGDLTKRNDDGTVTCTFTDPAVLKAADFYRTLRKENAIQSDYTKTYDDLKKEFAAGKMGMTLGSIGATGDFERLGMKREDIGYSVFPKGPAGLNPSQYGGNMFAINANSSKEKQEAAFLYTAYSASREWLIYDMKKQEEKGKSTVSLNPRSDIDPLQYQPSLVGQKDLFDLLKVSGNNLHLEYYAKAVLSDYINTAIAKITLDDNADPLTELKKAQELAEKESVVRFNDAITGKE